MNSVPSPGTARVVRHAGHPGTDTGNYYKAHWRINGFAATLTVWTAAAWDHLTERPPDAQYLPCGIWCALRMDD